MKLTDQAKRDILNSVLEVTADIADKEYQKRVWIRGEGPECDSYEDAVCNFSQEGNGVLKKYKDFGLSDSQYQILKNFRAEFKVFYKKNDYPEEFVDSPEWARIMEMAKEVLKAFDYKKKSRLRFRVDLTVYRIKSGIRNFCRFCVSIFRKPAVKSELQLETPVYHEGIPTFPRPQGIPEYFLVKITNTGLGMQYVNPENKGAYVRVMPGKPHSLLPYQREPYAVQMKDGQALDKHGDLIPSFSPDAHIPLNEFVFRKEYAY